VTDLVAFLRARLDEDEVWAHETRQEYERVYGPKYLASDVERDAGLSSGLNVAARVLREVEAKRQIVDIILQYEAKVDGEWGCCHSAEQIAAGLCPDSVPGEIEGLRLLALPYDTHPDYDAAWAPEA